MTEFTKQIKRMTKDWYNYVEPSAKATITHLNSDGTVNIQIQGIELSPKNVPVLQSCYGTIGSLNLSVDDNVLVSFVMGHIANPVVVGKF